MAMSLAFKHRNAEAEAFRIERPKKALSKRFSHHFSKRVWPASTAPYLKDRQNFSWPIIFSRRF